MIFLVLMKKLKLYLETSSWNFYYADDAPEKKAVTREFFDSLPNNQFDLYISEVVLEEIDKASLEKTAQLMSLIDRFDSTILVFEPTVKKLADAYLANQVLPSKAYRDAQHIALSTINELDLVVSWNLRHIANIHRQKKVNAINMLNGYNKPLQLITPMEVSYNDFEN
jgi:predicted nucleic acid-binding protein